ncbi:hypothetical protein ACFLXE_07595 [Chloroflexota bacterium]
MKSKKSRNHGASKSQGPMPSRDQVSIVSEARYIISLAESCDSRVVTLGSLLFFSTETGDAWVLDLGDNLALCLARGGVEQSFTISEDSTRFSIEWNAQYRIDGDAFIVIERSGRVQTIFGYPTAYISDAARKGTDF